MTEVIRAEMNYAGRGESLVRGATTVAIQDGRAAALPDWPECGFGRVDHTSAVADWTDDGEIASVHYPEIEALACRLTACDAALVSDHVKRSAEQAKREREQAPVRLVHSDFAPGYDAIVRTNYREVHGRGAATLARSGLTSDEIEGARRIVMMQFWRNLGAPKMDLPLAFLDARSVTLSETRPFHYTGYVAGGRSFDALAVVAPADPERHQWFWFPELRADEVVAFRTYDTDLIESGATFFTGHSAFRDPDVELGNPARFSIELRVMCVFR